MTFSGLPIGQDPDELADFIRLLRDHGVRRYLEIGARSGDTFHEIMTGLGPGAFGVALDLPGGAWGRRDSARYLRACCSDLTAADRTVIALIGDSHDPGITGTVTGLGPYDAVLIDGDHRYRAVVRDWTAYEPMARLIAFHDIAGTVVHKRHGPVDVPRVWRDLIVPRAKERGHDVVEIISPGNGYGIGVVVKKEPTDATLETL